MRLGAAWAEARRLDRHPFDPETLGAGGGGDGGAPGRSLGLGHRAADPADQEGGAMLGSAMGAGDKGIEALDPVGKALRDKKIERPVGHRRLRTESLVPQPVENVVGALCPVIVQQDFQHPPAHRRELQTSRAAMGIGGRDRGLDAGAVIVGLETQHGCSSGACRDARGHKAARRRWVLDML
ncbi:MAG: hypothetical protein K8F31_01875 [Roseovarius sp.]|nr:hypothetical protein [Roseovarius sp.]